MNPNPPECPREQDAVLFALHALEPDAREDFARHLRTCATCRSIIAEVEETFAEVGEAAARPAPPQLRERIMAATHERAGVRTDSRRGRVARLAPRDAAPRSPRRWAVLAAAAIVVLGIAGGGVLVAQLGHQREAATVHAATTDDVLAAVARSPHAVLVDRGGRPVAAVVLDGRPRFYAIDVAPPPPDRVWVLWGARGRAATALATVPAGHDGTTTAVPVGAPGQYEAFLLTQEPAGSPPTQPGDLQASGPVVPATTS